jgi:hypothetical protein
MVNEFMVSGRKITEGIAESDYFTNFDLASIRTDKLPGMAGFPQLSPAANPYGIVPGVTFSGVPNGPSIVYDARFPITAGDTRLSFSDNFSMTRGRHFIKAGFYQEFNISDEGRTVGSGTNQGGSIKFDVDRNNPLDTNYAFSNALTGTFKQYQQSDALVLRAARVNTWEWFVQDSWRATGRLTLDLGLRFSWIPPYTPRSGLGAAFVAAQYNRANAVRLYRPALDSKGQRVGQDPLTGAFVPALQIGAIVPRSGDMVNGTVLSNDTSYPAGWVTNQGVQASPRCGFAWDVFGNGRTAIRGGFGIMKQTAVDSALENTTCINPPLLNTPTIYYGNLATLSSQSGVYFPANTTGFELSNKAPSVYGYSLGVQQILPFQVALGIAYVGNQGKHQTVTQDLNTIPYGARFLPPNADPTKPSVSLPDSFLRPFPGYGSLQINMNASSTNYNSLQVTAKRRFSRGLAFGLAYTWSKAMDYGDSWGSVPWPVYRNADWAYGKASFDQTNVLTFNALWDVPKGSRLLPGAVSRVMLDGWQVSTYTIFASGNRLSITYTTTDNADITGGATVPELM